jgi:hypothetical protein
MLYIDSNASVLISISFCTLSYVTFTISLLTIEIDINTEVLGIVNGEIVKVTDESVQKEIDISTEVLGIVNSEIVKVTDDSGYFYYFTINFS